MSAVPLQTVFQQTFGQSPAVLACAPGRIEFIGNHTDYNGGLVMGAAIDRYIRVAAALRNDGRFHFASAEAGPVVELPRSDLVRQMGKRAWVNYPLGVLLELERAGMPMLPGLDIYITSDLPAGAGLSSSAALEMATAKALLHLAAYEMSLLETVRAARRAENNFVGMPCGILDQGVSGFGQAGHLVMIDCQTEVFSRLPLPDDAHFWILNSHEKHRLVESSYQERFDQCREAFSLLQVQLDGITTLAKITPEQFARVRHTLPELLARRAAHVIEENDRVSRCRDLLDQKASLAEIGALLLASHGSSRDQFENSTPALDTLVELAQGRPGVAGARLTGGGFGGAVLLLTDARFQADQAQSLIRDYHKARPQAPLPGFFHVRAGDGARVE